MTYNPTPENIRPRQVLTNFGVSWSQSSEGQGLVVPGIVPVRRKTDLYPVINKGDMTRLAMAPRAPATRAAKAEFGQTNEQFDCKRYGLEVALPDEYEDDYESRQDAERPRTHYLAEQAFLRVLTDFAAVAMTLATWTNNSTLAGATQWSDPSSDPITEIKRRNREMETRALKRGTVLFCGAKVADDLSEHPDVLARVTSGGTNERPAKASLMALAEVLELDRVIRIGGSQNTAHKGLAAVMSNVVGHVALLAYVNPAPTKDAPSAFKIFSYRRFDNFEGAAIGAPLIYRRFDEQEGCWYLGSELFYDVQRTADDAGFFWQDAVAS